MRGLRVKWWGAARRREYGPPDFAEFFGGRGVPLTCERRVRHILSPGRGQDVTDPARFNTAPAGARYGEPAPPYD